MEMPGKSILNMAEAMLNEDYKSSYSDLNAWYETSGLDNFMSTKKPSKAEQQEKEIGEAGNRERRPLEHTFQGKYDEKRVIIQEPPKRRKISTSVAPRDVVAGEF
jgi:hypothetical protein